MFLLRTIYHWRRLFCWVVVPLFVLFTLFNVVLNSSWMKGRVAEELERRTQERWSIGTLTYSLTGNLHCYDLDSRMEEGGVHVAHIVVRPNYSLLFDGRLRLSSVEIEQPKVVLSYAWLLESLRWKSTIQDAPVLAASDRNTPSTATDKEREQESTKFIGGADAVVANPTGAAKKIDVKTGGEQKTVGNHDPDDLYESWVKISNARVVVKGGESSLLVLDGLNADLPVGGKELLGELSWRGLSLFGREVVGQGKFRVAKNGPLLSVKETEVDFFGVQLRPDIYMGRSPHGAVFHIDMLIPEQAVTEIFTHLDSTVDLSVERVAGRMQLAGLMAHPMTWRGVADVRAEGVRVVEGHRGTSAYFENFVYQSYLSRGVVETPELRLQGEDIAVMSNGLLRMDGLGFGVVRLVTSPEKRDWVEKLVSRSQVFERMKGGAMRSLVTNDLFYLDLNIDGNVLDPMIQLDHKTDWQPLWPAVGRLRDFMKAERLEEGLQN